MFFLRLFTHEPIIAAHPSIEPELVEASPPHQVSIAIRVDQIVSTVGLGVAATGAITNGLEGKRIWAGGWIFIATVLTHKLWLIHRYSQLKTIGENTSTLERLKSSLNREEEDISKLNSDLLATTEKFTELEAKDEATMKSERKLEEDLVLRLSPMRQKVIETTKALKDAEQKLKERTLELETEIQTWKEQHAADQKSIDKLQKEIDDEKIQVRNLREEIQTLTKTITQLEKDIHTFQELNNQLKLEITQLGKATDPINIDQIAKGTVDLEQALRKTQETMGQIPALLALLENAANREGNNV